MSAVHEVRAGGLRGLRAAAIVASIADAAERWSDADFPPRVRVTRALERQLGWSEPVVDYALDQLFVGLRRANLEAAIADELGSLAALDGPVDRPGRPAAFARGVERVAIVASATTLGAALVPAIFALCAKCRVVVAARGDALVGAFFASLVDERPEFATAAVAGDWTGGTDETERALLADADVVVAFGRDTELHAIRDKLDVATRFIGMGQRASIGYLDLAGVAAPARPALLDAIATDALLAETGGGALHALFVSGPDAPMFGRDLAGAFDRVGIEFPAGSGLAPARAGGAIIFDPPQDAPPPSLPRVLPVFVVADATEVRAYVRRHQLPIAALGVPDSDEPAALALAEAVGASRIARFGRLHLAALGGHHGGNPRIADFVRWIDRD